MWRLWAHACGSIPPTTPPIPPTNPPVPPISYTPGIEVLGIVCGSIVAIAIIVWCIYKNKNVSNNIPNNNPNNNIPNNNLNNNNNFDIDKFIKTIK